MKLHTRILAVLLCAMLLLTGCSGNREQVAAFTGEGDGWVMGFGVRDIPADPKAEEGIYIAGYNQGWRAQGVIDLCQARAVWIGTGDASTLLIGVDTIALSAPVVREIRARLADLCAETGCDAVNVYSTHDHASVDTLGLWGPTGVDGKNDAYMERLIQAAVEAAQDAVADRKSGELRYGYVETPEEMFRDSREPIVYDKNLYQLRFVPDDGSAGIRMYQYGAHAESLRGSNTLLSRDFPGLLCDGVAEATGDRAMFMPGAIGGLIMTAEIVRPFSAYANHAETGRRLVEYALSIAPEDEQVVTPTMFHGRTELRIPMDNTGYMLYKFLGILENEIERGDSATGYVLWTELTVLRLGQLTLALIPGEIFPELVFGGGWADPEGLNPDPLVEIAAEHGTAHLLVVGLANDEIGYIVPQSEFLLHPDLPYLEKIEDEIGENHYEETNSVGPQCANRIAEAFERVMAASTSN